MGWTKLTYWSGSAECCAECLLAPCQCCCYNESNGALFDSDNFPNKGGPCNNLGDQPQFNAYTCTPPTTATCANMDEQSLYDAYTCVGDLMPQTATMLTTFGVPTTLFNNPAGPTFTTLERRWGVISCWPSSGVLVSITHEPSGGGASVVDNHLIVNFFSHYYTAVSGMNPMSGERRLTKVDVAINANNLPAGIGSISIKLCLQKLT